MAKKKPDSDVPAEQPTDLSDLELNLDDAPPVETPEPVAETEPEVGVDEPSLRPSVVSLARQRGYEVADDATDDDFWTRVETLEEQAARLEAAQKELEQHRQWRAQVEAEQSARKPEPAAAAEPEADDEDFGIPERPAIDRFTLGVLQLAKQNGLLKEGAGGLLTSDDASLRPQIDKYNQNLIAIEEYEREWGDPRKIASHMLDKRLAKEREAIRKQVLEEVQGSLSQRDDQAYFNEFNKQNAAWLFDATGTKFTAEGQAFADEVNDLLQRGYSAPVAMKRAQAWLQAETGKAPWNTEPPKKNDPPAAKVGKFINRLKNNGSHSPPANPVSRPAAGVGTRKFDGNVSKHLDATFDALMNEEVAERI